MRTYDIYVGTSSEEATGHGAEFVYDGFNPADALARFVADADAMSELRTHRPDWTSIEAYDEETSAAAYKLDDGTCELHVYEDGGDMAITLPPTEFVSITDAAEILGVSRQRVFALLKNGQLSGRKVGGTWSVCRWSAEKRLQG